MNKRMLNLIILGIITSLALAACAPQGGTQQQTQQENGRAVFTITDAAADMGSVNSVQVTVDSVDVRAQGETWTTVTTESQTYDLLELKASGTQALVADAELEPGTYTQIRLDISNVMVNDSEGEHEAKLPSGVLRLNGQLEVEANSTSTATFDFIADESLHVTGSGQYIMAPVVRLTTKSNASVNAENRNNVQIRGGSQKTDVTVGMNADGEVSVDARVPGNANITIDQGKVRITSGGDGMNINVNAGGEGRGQANRGNSGEMDDGDDDSMEESDDDGMEGSAEVNASAEAEMGMN